MTRNEISQHEIAVYRALTTHTWLTSKDIAEQAHVAPRTARAHALKLAELGIAEQAEVFPGHRYRLTQNANERNPDYIDLLNRAAEALGMEIINPGEAPAVDRNDRRP